ncbi:hypothetical protein ABH966_003072 [Lysinibacillus sp. RC46]|uniref:hypothetical protein n=1 Tax=unclassified Lysinibacillus TaxID=2636778 RepID=UPI003512B0C5
MFGFFRKKKSFEIEVDWFNKRLIAVLEKLPSKYSIYLKQIKEGILQGIFPVTGYLDNYIGVSFHREVVKKYEKKGEKSFSITGVKIFNKNMSKDVNLEIFFNNGVIAGVSSDVELIQFDLDLSKINIDFVKVKEKEIEGTIKRKLLSWGIRNFNESEVFEVKVEDRRMLHLRDLSDGDFLAIEDGDFYIISISLKEVLKISSAHYENVKMNLFDLSEDDIYSYIQE